MTGSNSTAFLGRFSSLDTPVCCFRRLIGSHVDLHVQSNGGSVSKPRPQCCIMGGLNTIVMWY